MVEFPRGGSATNGLPHLVCLYNLHCSVGWLALSTVMYRDKTCAVSYYVVLTLHAAVDHDVEVVPAKISEDQVSPKILSKAGVCKNISLKLHSKAGVGKNVKINIFPDTTFLESPALECKIMEIFLPTLEIQYIFGGTSSTFVYWSHSLPRISYKYFYQGF